MAATVTVRRWWGASGSPTKTDITTATSRACTYDNAAPGTSWPIPIPTSGAKYSYWVTTRLSADVTPAGTINNIRWYTDGTPGFGTGVSYVAGEASYYVQATGTPSDTGTQLTQGAHAGLIAAPYDGFGKTSAAPEAVDGSITNPSTGDFGNFMVQQLLVFAAAGPGAVTAETMTFKLIRGLTQGRPCEKTNRTISANARRGNAEAIPYFLWGKSVETACVALHTEMKAQSDLHA